MTTSTFITEVVLIGQHNDSRMNIALIMTAVQQGAVVANHVEVMELHKDPASGKLTGARVQDKLTGRGWDVRAKVSSLISALLRSHSENSQKIDRASSMPLVLSRTPS